MHYRIMEQYDTLVNIDWLDEAAEIAVDYINQ